MRSSTIMKAIAITQLAAALPWHGVYLLGYHLRDSGPSLYLEWGIEGLLFVLSPIVSVYGALTGKKWTYLTLMVFPLLAFIHGISAIPYLSYIAPVGMTRTYLLMVINGGMICMIVWLRFRKETDA